MLLAKRMRLSLLFLFLMGCTVAGPDAPHGTFVAGNQVFIVALRNESQRATLSFYYWAKPGGGVHQAVYVVAPNGTQSYTLREMGRNCGSVTFEPDGSDLISLRFRGKTIRMARETEGDLSEAISGLRKEEQQMTETVGMQRSDWIPPESYLPLCSRQ